MQKHVFCIIEKKEQTQNNNNFCDPKASILIFLTNFRFALGNDHLFREKMKGDGLTGSPSLLHCFLIYSLVILDEPKLSLS